MTDENLQYPNISKQALKKEKKETEEGNVTPKKSEISI